MGGRFRYVLWGAGLALAVLVASALWLGRGTLGPATSGPAKTLTVEPSGCNPAVDTCTAKADDMILHVRLGPPVVVLKSFPVTVRLHPSSRFAVRQVLVQFTMKGMDMGLNRYRLVSDGDGRWTGTAMLPVCTTGRTDWLATVVLSGPGGERRAQFAFSAALH